MQELRYKIYIRTLSTDELILRFCSELADIQTAITDARLGMLLLSISYNQEREAIKVIIVEGKNLPAMDRSGNYLTSQNNTSLCSCDLHVCCSQTFFYC